MRDSLEDLGVGGYQFVIALLGCFGEQVYLLLLFLNKSALCSSSHQGVANVGLTQFQVSVGTNAQQCTRFQTHHLKGRDRFGEDRHIITEKVVFKPKIQTNKLIAFPEEYTDTAPNDKIKILFAGMLGFQQVVGRDAYMFAMAREIFPCLGWCRKIRIKGSFEQCRVLSDFG